MKIKQLITRTLLLFVTFLAYSAENYTIQHVEPSNWWIGMKNPQLQILVYGTNIGLTQPEITYPSVTIDSVVHTENNNYLFL